MVFGRLIDLLPGQFLFRGPQLADRLHIDRNKIYRLIKLFEQEDMISVKKIGRRYSIITVKNYSVYQGDSIPIEKERETNDKPKDMDLCNFEGSSLQESEKQMRNKRETIYKNQKKHKNINNNINSPEIPFDEIITYLNEKTGKNYRSKMKSTRRLIQARFNEGFTLEDFKKVIDNKVADWNHVPSPGEKDMRPYLRPETLFGTKFESYLNSQPAVRRILTSAASRNNFQQREYDDSFFEQFEKLSGI